MNYIKKYLKYKKKYLNLKKIYLGGGTESKINLNKYDDYKVVMYPFNNGELINILIVKEDIIYPLIFIKNINNELVPQSVIDDWEDDIGKVYLAKQGPVRYIHIVDDMIKLLNDEDDHVTMKLNLFVPIDELKDNIISEGEIGNVILNGRMLDNKLFSIEEAFITDSSSIDTSVTNSSSRTIDETLCEDLFIKNISTMNSKEKLSYCGLACGDIDNDMIILNYLKTNNVDAFNKINKLIFIDIEFLLNTPPYIINTHIKKYNSYEIINRYFTYTLPIVILYKVSKLWGLDINGWKSDGYKFTNSDKTVEIYNTVTGYVSKNDTVDIDLLVAVQPQGNDEKLSNLISKVTNQKYNIIWTGSGSHLGDFKGIIRVDHNDPEIVKGNLGGPKSLN
mgnify:CR=1 FL=1|tara:strand:+ start:6 stop:1181 length:1176 start_codon:yes stop_codon:yes gene_type:complete